jgi:16S rRNA (guanine(966)-N(2))-methyltransferase RsmD
VVEHRITLDGADVLDLFAGTGALGLEAISRGADVVTFVESVPAVLAFARRNADALDVGEQCVFFRADALTYLRQYQGPKFDLILADPPYELDGLTTLPDLARPLLKEDGLFVLEHDRRHAFDEQPGVVTSRPYGRTLVTVFTASP